MNDFNPKERSAMIITAIIVTIMAMYFSPAWLLVLLIPLGILILFLLLIWKGFTSIVDATSEAVNKPREHHHYHHNRD